MRRLWLGLLALLLTGCTLPGGGQPSVEAVLTEMVAGISAQRALTEPQLLLTEQVSGGTLTLFTYQVDQGAGSQPMTAVGIMTVRRVGFGWVNGGNGGIVASDDPRPPVQFLTNDVDSGDVQYSVVYGLVHDSAVREISVTFADGSSKVATVENGAYLLVAQPRQPIHQIEALDADGQVLHQRDE